MCRNIRYDKKLKKYIIFLESKQGLALFCGGRWVNATTFYGTGRSTEHAVQQLVVSRWPSVCLFPRAKISALVFQPNRRPSFNNTCPRQEKTVTYMFTMHAWKARTVCGNHDARMFQHGAQRRTSSPTIAARPASFNRQEQPHVTVAFKAACLAVSTLLWIWNEIPLVGSTRCGKTTACPIARLD